MTSKAIVAQKVGMTQIWDEDNRVVPVTVLRVPPCRVVQIKTDGFLGRQLSDKSCHHTGVNHIDTCDNLQPFTRLDNSR